MNLRAWFSRKRADRDLEDELQFHIEMQTRKNLAAGMSSGEAARRARIQFGGATQVQESCRDARGLGIVETTWQDVRYAMRGFLRAPGFVITVVATIALGLGLNTAFFTIFNATYFRPIAVRDSASLFELYWVDRTGHAHDFSWPEYGQFLPANPAFASTLGLIHTQARLDGRTVLGTLVTGEFFQTLGVGASLGRTLLPEDAIAPGRQPVVMLSYRAWQTRFVSDPQIIGRRVLLRGILFEVVGVAPPGFTGIASRPTEFWAPLTMAPAFESGPDLFGSGQPRALTIVGRLRPDHSERQAQAGLTLWAQHLTETAPDAGKANRGVLVSRASAKPLSVSATLAFVPILVAFSLVLLIGCANVANMMLARSVSRQREIAIRLSLGAARGRLVRQLLTESLLLALPAAVAGLFVSQAAIRICVSVLLATLPPGANDFSTRVPQFTPDLRVFAFTLVFALLSAVLFGLVPALQASRADFSRQYRPSRFRNSLVIGQITVCVLLLVTAGHLLRGLDAVHGLDSGLSTRPTLDLSVQEKSREAILSRLAAEPSLELLGAAKSAPVDRKILAPVMPADGGTLFSTATNRVSPEYFALFDLPILRGRNFTAAEAVANAPVAVLSQSAAQRLWPNRDAVGRSLHVDPNLTVSVIGVARDEISRWISNGEDRSLVYFPASVRAAGNHILLSVHGDAQAARRKLEADLTALDPRALEEIRKIQIREWVEEDAYYTFRVAYWLSSAVGCLALLLTLSGIYGVLSFVISQRTKEIGIRIAMGASARSVTNLALLQILRLACIGVVLGGVLALGLARAVASVVVVVHVFDPAVYLGAVLLVLAASAAAAYVPSRRAAHIDPLITLRYD